MVEQGRVRPEAAVTPALTEALQRLDQVQADVRQQAAVRTEIERSEPKVVWQAPAASELAEWKKLNPVKYMGQVR